ncbi:MAG: hypothetical protein IPP29_18945 [Bacteroidetes bacterium]|nr:hypothetical protein [Bacteroidota bacterium]
MAADVHHRKPSPSIIIADCFHRLALYLQTMPPVNTAAGAKCPGDVLSMSISTASSTNLPNGSTIEWVNDVNSSNDVYDESSANVVASQVISAVGTHSNILQDFNTLINTGSTTWVNNSTLPNWYLFRTGPLDFFAGDGSSNLGVQFLWQEIPLKWVLGSCFGSCHNIT